MATIAPTSKLMESKKYQGYANLMELAISTGSYDHHSLQLDRESNNDSGYSSKPGGSSHGPSPSLSGNQVMDLDHLGANFNLNAHPLVNNNHHHFRGQAAAVMGPSLGHFHHNQMMQQHQLQHHQPHVPYDVNGEFEGFAGASSLV